MPPVIGCSCCCGWWWFNQLLLLVVDSRWLSPPSVRGPDSDSWAGLVPTCLTVCIRGRRALCCPLIALYLLCVAQDVLLSLSVCTRQVRTSVIAAKRVESKNKKVVLDGERCLQRGTFEFCVRVSVALSLEYCQIQEFFYLFTLSSGSLRCRMFEHWIIILPEGKAYFINTTKPHQVAFKCQLHLVNTVVTFAGVLLLKLLSKQPGDLWCLVCGRNLPNHVSWQRAQIRHVGRQQTGEWRRRRCPAGQSSASCPAHSLLCARAGQAQGGVPQSAAACRSHQRCSHYEGGG